MKKDFESNKKTKEQLIRDRQTFIEYGSGSESASSNEEDGDNKNRMDFSTAEEPSSTNVRSNYDAKQSPDRSRSQSSASSSSSHSSDSSTPVKKRRGADKKATEAKRTNKGEPKNASSAMRNLSAYSSNRRGMPDNRSASRGSEGNQTLTSFLQMGLSKANATQCKK